MSKKPHWMQRAFSAHPGALHRKLGVPTDQKIPESKLKAAHTAAVSSGDTKTLRQLNLAKTAKKIRTESVFSYVVKEFREDFPGQSDNGGHDVDPEQLKIGIEEEHEHKDVWDLIKDRVSDLMTEEEFYEKIARKHLDSVRDYYDRLKKYVEND